MSFKELCSRALLGLSMTALITVATGGVGYVMPLSHKTPEITESQVTKPLKAMSPGPQCKISRKILGLLPGFPRCESSSAQIPSGGMH